MCPRLHQAYIILHTSIYLSGCWPRSISISLGHEPDGWPEPVTGWQLGSNFDLSVLESKSIHGTKSSGHDRIEDVISTSCSLATVKGGICASKSGINLWLIAFFFNEGKGAMLFY